jgi:hypothetical protein
MGLFSKKQTAAPAGIPQDILDEVIVNGVGVRPSVSVAPTVTRTQPETQSPFLQTAPEPKDVPPVQQENESKSSASAADMPVIRNPFLNHAVTQQENVTKMDEQAIPSQPKPFSIEGTDPAIHFQKTELAAVPTSEEVVLPQVAETELRAQAPAGQAPDFSQLKVDPLLHKKIAEFEEQTLDRPKEKKLSPTVLSFFVFILILALIAGGSWYYLSTRNQIEPTTEQSINDIQAATVEVSKDSLSVTPPQYLAIDVETATPDSLRTLLKDEGAKMISEGTTSPREFLVTDTNSNPIAFSRFLLLFGGDPKSSLAVGAGESFSLYLFVDEGVIRTALATSVKPESMDSFVANPSSVLASVKTIFFETPLVYAIADKQVFSSSQYNTTAIQYTNIDSTQGFSFDVARVESSLVMANSKNTLRAVLDARQKSSQ